MKRSLNILALIVSASFCLQASAATITVNSTADPTEIGKTTLRDAINAANATSGADTIAFSVTGTILLASALPELSDDVDISGPGANTLAVNGNAAFRIFEIGTGADVTIDGLTIMNGHVVAPSAGGGILNFGTLTVTNSTISGNSATGTDGAGGGIFNLGTLTVTNSTISGNSPTATSSFGFGGGIANSGGTLTVTNSTISDNSATGITGASGLGGGIDNGGMVTVTNSTISDNSATSSGGSGAGGGIFNNSALNLNTSIVGNNSASSNSPDILGTVSSGDYNLIETTSGYTLPAGSTHNITGVDPKLDTNGLQPNGGPTLTIALQLDSPAINAGTDLTALSGAIDNSTMSVTVTDATSIPAGVGVAIQIDSEQLIVTAKAGNTLTVTRGANGTTAAAHTNGAVVNPAFDQRGAGFARKFGSAVDIGAFEVQTAPACPHAKGYWKNNPNLWPASALPMALGTQTYTQTELLRILRTAVGSGRNADASLILADQLIAAKLNIANGSDPAPVSDTIDDADAVLSLPGRLPYRVRPNTTNGRRMVSDANTLNSYNNGLLTPVCTP